MGAYPLGGYGRPVLLSLCFLTIGESLCSAACIHTMLWHTTGCQDHFIVDSDLQNGQAEQTFSLTN